MNMENNVTILYFGQVAELLSRTEDSIELPAAATARAVRQALTLRNPELGKLTFRISVNRQLAQEETEVRNGDEIALLPPFAGG